MRIVAIADSVSLPRIVEKDKVLWEETWPFLLQENLKKKKTKTEVINCGKRARKITSLLSFDFTEHIIFKQPDTLVLQIGVVDAAPRMISLREKRILNHRLLPSKLREIYIKNRKLSRSKIIARNPLAKVYTKPKIFTETLQLFQQKLNNTGHTIQKVMIIPILAFFDKMEGKSPGYQANIQLYNGILEEYCKNQNHQYIEVSEEFGRTSEYFCSDGYHLSSKGHYRLAQILNSYF